jgi:rSAM/selenodomain-associated transferase 1
MAAETAAPAPVAIAILAKAPIAGFAKTRLSPVLGDAGAAALQARLTERAVATAVAAAIGPVTLWAAPDARHPAFLALAERFGISLAPQPDGDLGARMLAALDAAGPAVVIGTDCPALTAEHLRASADALRADIDVVTIPVEDGGYALIGTRTPVPALFRDMRWSTADVMAETRRRLATLGLTWREIAMLWDVDVPDDLARLRAAGFGALLGKDSE